MRCRRQPSALERWPIHLSDEELGRVYRLKHGESQEEYKQRQQALEKQDWMLQMCYSTPRVTGIAPR